ncbi:MAG: DUF285 domain-containing protein, partial [Proteobacteria bacterium]|nr:DUF285 domain-containing protein [Pseudomonadota bacterium]
TNMRGMFKCATAFNQPLNNWDTSNVTNMNTMFFGLYNDHDTHDYSGNPVYLDNIIITGRIGNGYSYTSICKRATNFNQPLNDWDTSNVTNMSCMFSGTHFNHPLYAWNTSNVTNMHSMFRGAAFNQSLNDWNISKVTDMENIFKSSGLNSNNYCALFRGAYSSYWQSKKSSLGKSYSCN